VLTLWAAVVAERLGYDRDEALTLGRAVAGLNAQSKREQLEGGPAHAKTPKPRPPAGAKADRVELLGRSIPAIETPDGIRALERGQAAKPAAVERYLESKFGEALPAVRAAMTALARAIPRGPLSLRAYSLYERFRPAIPRGMRGWGAKGELDLDAIRALAKER